MTARVAFSRCADYATAEVHGAVAEAMSLIGGMAAVVSPGQSVLLKPNMLTDKEPERAVTTHPEVVRAAIRLVKEAGGDPSVGDSPANVTKIEKVWERTGFRALCEEEGVPLINLEEAEQHRVTVGNMSFAVARPVLDADVLVSIPKVKTHVLTIFTGAVKNLYGAVPGFLKTDLHKANPTPSQFGDLIAAIYGVVKPQLAIADGIVGMEGDGPSGGSPVRLGIIAASADSVALDAALCRILGIELQDVPYFKGLQLAGAGTSDWDNIETAGAAVDDIKPSSFKVPGTLRGRLIPGALVKLLSRFLWIKPVFHDGCRLCARCVKACPAQALTIEEGDRPTLNRAKCIQCCCCHEVCPEHVVEMKLSPLFSFFRRGRLP